MNALMFCLLLSIFVWSVLFNTRLLLTYFVLFVLYLVGYARNLPRSIDSFRRKMQIATWSDAGEPLFRARLEIAVEPIDRLIREQNATNPSRRITYTPVFVKALAEGLAAVPSFCGKTSFGTIIDARAIDLSIVVNIEGEDLSAATVRGCESKSIRELAGQARGDIKSLKKRENEIPGLGSRLARKLPGFVIQAVLEVVLWITYDWGLGLKSLKLEPNSFGFGGLSNVSMFGIRNAEPPLVPNGRTLLAAILNAPFDKPVALDGRVQVQRTANLNLTFDHRFGQLGDIIKVVRRTQEVLQNPHRYL